MTRPQPQGHSSAESLLIGLRAQGFTLRVDEDKLLVSPLSKLTPIQLAAVKAAKQELIDLLLWETAPMPSDTTLEGWFADVDRLEQKGEQP